MSTSTRRRASAPLNSIDAGPFSVTVSDNSQDDGQTPDSTHPISSDFSGISWPSTDNDPRGLSPIRKSPAPETDQVFSSRLTSSRESPRGPLNCISAFFLLSNDQTTFDENTLPPSRVIRSDASRSIGEQALNNGWKMTGIETGGCRDGMVTHDNVK